VEGESIAAQEDWILSEGRLMNAARAHIITDAGLSGKTTDKRQLGKIVKLVKEESSSILCVRAVDRIGRDLWDAIKLYLDFFGNGGKSIRTPKAQFDYSITSFFMYVIEAWSAQRQVESNAYACQRSKKLNLKLRRWKSKRIPFGYAKEGDWLRKLKELEPVICDIFSLFIEHRNYTLVVNKIKTDYTHLHLELNRYTVTRILSFPLYAGVIGSLEDADHDPLLAFVSVATFMEVQRIRSEVATNHTPHEIGPVEKLLASDPGKIEELLKGFAELRHIVCGGLITKNGTIPKALWQQIFTCSECGDSCRIPRRDQLEELVGPQMLTVDAKRTTTSKKKDKKLTCTNSVNYQLDQFS